MKEIETSKGKWKLVEIKSIQEGQYYVDKIGSFHYKLSEITELEASSIVDESFNTYNEHSFVYYGYYVFSGCYIVTAIQSLHSLIESQGIEITNNTYIFKV